MPIVDVRPEERLPLTVGFAVCFGVIAAHTMAETARDALFLVHVSAARLPFMYIAIGFTSLALGALADRVARRFGQRASMVGVVLLGAVVAVTFRVAFTTERRWLFYAFYIWTGTFATTAVVELWLFVSSIFTVAQGKRLYGLIGAGASLGTFAGALVAVLWARWIAIEQVLYVVAGVLVVTALLPLLLSTPPRVDPPQQDRPERLELLSKPYLVHLALLVFASSVTLTIVDYQFKAAAAAAVPAARLAVFIGATYAVLGGASLLVHASAGRIIRATGVAPALAILPALLALGGVALPALRPLGKALALRSTDGVLRHSLHRVGMELLYMPLSVTTRSRIKAFLDGTVSRVAQAMASVLLLAIGLHAGRDRLLVIAIVVGALVWLVLAVSIRRPYVRRFLQIVDPQDHEMARFPDLEGAALGIVVAALNEPDERLVIAALDLLAARGHREAIPTGMLSSTSPKVVAKAIDLLVVERGAEVSARLDALLEHADASVRAAAVRAAIALDVDPARLRPRQADPSAVVRALVAVRLGDEAALKGMASGPREVQAALLLTTADVELVRRLAPSRDPVVLRAACGAVTRLRDPSLLPTLISRLDVGAARHAVRNALAAFGVEALPALEAALEDPSTDAVVRRHVPRTLAMIQQPRSAQILARNLSRQADGVVRYKLILGLGRLRGDRPDFVFPEPELLEYTRETAHRAQTVYAWRALLVRGQSRAARRATETGRLLVSILSDKLELGMRRLFRLLAIVYPEGDLSNLRHALTAADPRRRAAAHEVLENLLDFGLRAWVLPLCDELDEAVRFDVIARHLGALPEDYGGVLRAVGRLNDTMAKLTARHASELRDA